MTNIFSAIRDDIKEYEELCNKYDEPVQYNYDSPDCYGEHAKELKNRSRHDEGE